MEHERNYEDKEVTVYFKIEDDELILVTASAQYGSDFPRDPNASGPTAPTSECRRPVRIGYGDGQFLPFAHAPTQSRHRPRIETAAERTEKGQRTESSPESTMPTPSRRIPRGGESPDGRKTTPAPMAPGIPAASNFRKRGPSPALGECELVDSGADRQRRTRDTGCSSRANVRR